MIFEHERVTISKQSAEILDRWFLPHNPAKIRRPKDIATRTKIRAAIQELRTAIRGENGCGNG